MRNFYTLLGRNTQKINESVNSVRNSSGKVVVLMLFLLTSVSNLHSQYCLAATTNVAITPGATSLNTAIYNSGCRAFNFVATVGCTYTFATCGLSTADTYLRLYSTGTGGSVLITADDNCSAQSSFAWTCTTAGTYSVLLTNYSCIALTANTSMSYIRSCPENTVPSTGSNSYTLCSGVLYDHAGSAGNYLDNVNGYSVINPATVGNMVRLSGTTAGEGCCDYLYIYNGVGILGTLLWSGVAGAGTVPTITSTLGPLTVRFTSDGSVVGAGFALNISCVAPALCSGTPAPGNTLASSASVTIGSTVNLTLSTPPTGTGLTYEWQSGTSNSGPWTTIATSAVCSPTIAGATWFRCIVTCGGNPGTSTPVFVEPLSCIPYTNSTCCMGISQVVFNTINNYSGTTNNIYQNFTNLTTNIEAGTTTNLSITGWSYGQYASVWVDLNNNYVFEASERLATGVYMYTNCNVNIAIPNGTSIGNHRMRIRTEYDGYGAINDPCATVQYGETEDYTINVTAPCVPPTTVGFGINTWNVLGYEHTLYNFINIGTLAGNTFKGHYSDATVDINSQAIWSSTSTPSSAVGWTGCPVSVELHTVVYKRQGFPTAFYQIDLNTHDDGVQCYVNGTLVYEIDGCCADRGIIWSGVLCSTSTVEFRVMEGGGGSNLLVDFIDVPVTAGTISGTQTFCPSATAVLTSNGNTGGAWSSSNGAVASVDAAGLVSAIGSGSATIIYTVNGGACGNVTTSLPITVVAGASAGVLSGTQTACVGATTAFTSDGTAGGTWTSSDGAIATVSAAGLVSAIAAGSATISYTVAGSGGCPNAIATRIVTTSASPTADAGADVVLCPGQTTVLGIAPASSSTAPISSSAYGNDNTNFTTAVTVSGAIAGATITSLTFTPNIFYGGYGTNACIYYNTWYVMQYWNGSSWVNLSCGSSVTINDFNGTIANGLVFTIRVVDGDNYADAVTISIDNLTVNYLNTTTYSWLPVANLSSTTISNPTSSATITTTYTLTASANGCSTSDNAVVTINTATPASVVTASGISLATGDLLWSGNSSTVWGSNTNWYAYDGTNFVIPGTGIAPTASNRVFVLPSSTSGICISATNNTYVTAAGSAKDVFIGTGATMVINSSQVLQVNGNWTNNGTFTQDATATVQFTGGDPQTLGGLSVNDFTNLTLNKSADLLILNAPATVSGTLTMTAGDISTTALNLLTVGTSTSATGSIAWTGGSVLGPIKRWFASGISSTPESGIFPVGLAGKNRYAQVNHVVGAVTPLSVGGSITAEYKAGSCPDATNPLLPLYSGLPTDVNGQMIQNYENEGYWSIAPATGVDGGNLSTAQYSLKLRGNTLSTVTLGAMGQLRMIKSSDPHTSWDNGGIGTNTGATGSELDFTITNTGMTGFSWFNIGSGQISWLPVTMLDFAANCNEKSEVDLKWSTASEQNSENFIIERSRNLTQWEYVSTVNAAGNSNYNIDYSTVDSDPLAGVSYYRLAQVDNNGAQTIYGPISVSCSDNENGMVVFPNPTQGNFTVEISTEEDLRDSQLVITDLSGKIISIRKINVLQGKTQAIFENQELQLGTYIIELISGNQTIQPVRIVVE